MMIFQKAALVYLAVPKTGTTSLEHELDSKASAVFRNPPGLKHTNIRGFERKFRNIFERGMRGRLETVAVFRDPLDWLGSWYRYRSRPQLDGHKNSTKDVSFDEFLVSYLAETPPPYADLGSQGRFVTNQANDLAVDHLFQYERIEELYGFLSDRLSVPVVPPRLNASPKGQLSASPETVALLQTQYALDFEIHASLAEASFHSSGTGS